MKKVVSLLLVLVLLLSCTSAFAINSQAVGTKKDELKAGERQYPEQPEAGSLAENSWYYTSALSSPNSVKAAAINSDVSLSWSSVTYAGKSCTYCIYEKINGSWRFLDIAMVSTYKLKASNGNHRYGVSSVLYLSGDYFESKYVTYVDIYVDKSSDTAVSGDNVQNLTLSGKKDKTINVTAYENTVLHIKTDGLTWYATNGAIVTPYTASNDIYFTSLGNNFYYKPASHLKTSGTVLVMTMDYKKVTYGGATCYSLGDTRAYFTINITLKPGKAPVPVSGITLNKSKVTLTLTSKQKKPTYQLKATVAPSNATNKKVKWSSSDKTIATVDSKGKVTALKAGTCKITCKAADGSGAKATCTITVKQTKVSSITLDKTKLSLKAGKSYALKVSSIKPADAYNKKVKWTTSDKKVATVDSSGKVTAVKKGKCVIRCTSADGSKVYAECAITVK